MFWKEKTKLLEEDQQRDYYVLVGKDEEGSWCNLHYSEDVYDPLFWKICEELISNLLANNIVIICFEILKNQEALSILSYLEMKNCSKETYAAKEDQIMLKSIGVDIDLLEEYWEEAKMIYVGYRSPRQFSLYGFYDQKASEGQLLDLDKKIEKGLYDISILYQEPPQSLEFEVKNGCMDLDELCDLILRVSAKYSKRVNVILNS